MNEKINRNDIFLEGNLVVLKVLTEDDVFNSNWYGWFNNEVTMQYMQKHYFPNTKDMQLAFLKNHIENNQTKLQLGIVHKFDNVLIGTISLNEIDFLNRRCEISGFIGERNYHNFKFFIEANQLILKHGFDALNMNKIYGGTLIKEISMMYCRVLGFKEEGVKRCEIYKNGKYHDVYLISILRDEYYKQVGLSGK